MKVEDCIDHIRKELNLEEDNSYLKVLGVSIKEKNSYKYLVSILGEELYRFPRYFNYTKCIYITNTICDRYDITFLPLTFEEWFLITNEWIKYRSRGLFSIEYSRHKPNKGNNKNKNKYRYYLSINCKDDSTCRKYGAIKSHIACEYLYSLALNKIAYHKNIKILKSSSII